MRTAFVATSFALGVLSTVSAGPNACDHAGSRPNGRDMRRAHNTVQSERVGGKNHHEIAHKINSAVVQTEVPVRSCENWSLEELNQLIRDMSCHWNEHFARVYARNEEKVGKRDGRSRRFDSMEKYEKEWLLEVQKVAEFGDVVMEPLRDAKCAEALMHWTHHVPAQGKETLINEQGVSIPTLPIYNATHAEHEDEHVSHVYASSYTCQTGHGMSSAGVDGSDHVLPHWPTEVHYTGTGYGAYPFWAGGAGTGESGPIEVYWSEKKAAELFYHEGCYMSEVGYGTGSTPCYHLMTGVLGSAKGYLYSADGAFCCESTGKPEDLAPPQSDFMDDMTLEGTYDVQTAYYSGDAYWYTETLDNSEAVTAFWYATTLDGYPIQQGEGGYGPNSPTGKGIFIYHEYNYTAWKEGMDVDIDSSVFDIPDICVDTSNKCTFP